MGSFYDKIKTMLSPSNLLNQEMIQSQDKEQLTNTAVDDQVYLTALDSPEELQPINLQIKMTPNIPVGFKWDDQSTVDIDVSLDTSTLKIAKEEIYRELAITFEDEGANHTINCEVPIAKIYVLGSIFTNVVVSGFEPINELQLADHSSNFSYQKETGFSKTDTVVVNQLSGYGCNYEDISKRNYDIAIQIGQPYIILEDGTVIKLEPALTGQEVSAQDMNTLHASYIGNEALNGQQSYDMYVPAAVNVRIMNPGS